MMFIKHYAPNRCFFFWGGRVGGGSGCWGGGGGQGGCEWRSEAFVKIQKKKIFFVFFWGGVRSGLGGGGQGGWERGEGGRGDVYKEWKLL